MKISLEAEEIDTVIEMVWEDRTPFDAIFTQFGLREADVKALMKKELKFSSYRLWRARVEIVKQNIHIKEFPKLIGLNVTYSDPLREIKFQNDSI